MKAVDIVDSLYLPTSTFVDRKVPKKLLLENGAPTAADKRAVNEGIEELVWVATLKPSTIGVPEFRDEAREYLEISVLRTAFRVEAKETRLIELVHRAIPYPVMLVAEGGCVSVSLAHKRRAMNEASAVVLDGEVRILCWDDTTDAAYSAPFCDGLRLDGLPHRSLLSLYDGLLDVVFAVEAARLTGTFSLPASPEHATIRRAALSECQRLAVEAGRLRAAAVKEKQIARQVKLNLEMKRAEIELMAARARL